MQFKLWQSSKDKQFYWALVSRNGERVAHSEGYTSKQGAKKGINAVKRGALFAKVTEL